MFTFPNLLLFFFFTTTNNNIIHAKLIAPRGEMMNDPTGGSFPYKACQNPAMDYIDCIYSSSNEKDCIKTFKKNWKKASSNVVTSIIDGESNKKGMTATTDCRDFSKASNIIKLVQSQCHLPSKEAEDENNNDDISKRSCENLVHLFIEEASPGPFCFEDAKICSSPPDKEKKPSKPSSVVRDPERDCQFPPCPDDILFCTLDVRGCDDGSFVSRDPFRDCQFDPCPPNDCMIMASDFVSCSYQQEDEEKIDVSECKRTLRQMWKQNMSDCTKDVKKSSIEMLTRLCLSANLSEESCQKVMRLLLDIAKDDYNPF